MTATGTPGRLYRSASGTPDSLTPRPGSDDLPGGGLSFWRSPDEPRIGEGKYVEVDPGKFRDLLVAEDQGLQGHVLVRPASLSRLREWAATRGTGAVHPLTRELLDAVTDIGRK
jgi:hypothetical protein